MMEDADSIQSVSMASDSIIPAKRVSAVHKADTLRNVAIAGEQPDSIVADSVPAEHHYGVLQTPPEVEHVGQRNDMAWDMSYIYGVFLLLFCVIGLRFRDSRKYISVMIRNLIKVRIRSNVFDETVRETSFLVLLNLMCSCSMGVLLYGAIEMMVSRVPEYFSLGLSALTEHKAASVGICMGVGVVYSCFMATAYYLVGTVFSDRRHAEIWLKGFTAAQGLLGFIYFPLALMLLCWPQWLEIFLWVGLASFVLSKIVFIWKGFRIFFTQFSSWLLFLYYLCSLEIVPLILTYLAAIWLCGFLH